MLRKMILPKAKSWVPILVVIFGVSTILPRWYSEFVNNSALIELKKLLFQEQEPGQFTGTDIEGILDKLEAVQQRQPRDGRYLRAYGLALWQAGDLQGAANTFEAALETSAEDQIVRSFLGEVKSELGNVAEARAIWAGSPDCAILMYKVFSKVSDGDYEMAEYLLDASCDAALDSDYVAYNLPRTYSILQKHAAQIGDQDSKDKLCVGGSQVFEKLLLLEPANGQIRIGFGQFLRECGHASEALMQLGMVGDIVQPGLRALLNVETGLAYSQLGEAAEALTHFEQAVQIDPDNASNRILYGHALATSGSREQALGEYRVAADSSYLPWRSWAYGEMGMLYQDSGEWLSAVDMFEQAINLDPTRDDYRVLLGKVLVEVGKNDEARIQLVEASGSPNAAWRRWAQQELDRLDSRSSDN